MSEISIIAQNYIEADLNLMLDYLERKIDNVILSLEHIDSGAKKQEAKLHRLNRLYYWYQMIQMEFW